MKLNYQEILSRTQIQKVSRVHEHKYLNHLVRMLILLTALTTLSLQIYERKRNLCTYIITGLQKQKKIMDLINKREKCPQTIQLVKRARDNATRKPSVQISEQPKPKILGTQNTGQKGRDQISSIDL